MPQAHVVMILQHIQALTHYDALLKVTELYADDISIREERDLRSWGDEAPLNPPVECGCHSLGVWLRAPHCLGLKRARGSPRGAVGSRFLGALLLEPHLGLSPRTPGGLVTEELTEPRNEEVTVPGTVWGEG